MNDILNCIIYEKQWSWLSIINDQLIVQKLARIIKKSNTFAAIEGNSAFAAYVVSGVHPSSVSARQIGNIPKIFPASPTWLSQVSRTTCTNINVCWLKTDADPIENCRGLFEVKRYCRPKDPRGKHRQSEIEWRIRENLVCTKSTKSFKF